MTDQNAEERGTKQDCTCVYAFSAAFWKNYSYPLGWSERTWLCKGDPENAIILLNIWNGIFLAFQSLYLIALLNEIYKTNADRLAKGSPHS